MHRFILKIALFIFLLNIRSIKLFDVDHYLDPFDSHPRLLVKNGHLVMLTGRNKDIVFRSSGSGQIRINGNDLLASKIQSLNQGYNNDNGIVSSQNSPIDKLLDRKLSIVETRISSRIDDLVQRLNDTINFQKKIFGRKQFRRIRTMAKRLDRLEKLLTKNECENNPCQNGATCEDGFNQYFCRCPKGFVGANCEQDFDECVQYQGTELGCQNGGSCLNTFGGFVCLCPPNHQGLRCNIEFNDCHNVSDYEICGQGLCLNTPRKQNNVASFRCVCFQGFAKSNPNLESAPCDIDIDECRLGIDRCSKDPPVECINTRDGYRCAPCPTGYTGDGFHCSLYDRCSLNNGGCSVSPRVSCFPSSFPDRVICGPCPPGYVGDGIQCSSVDGDICSTNNGGCSPDAQCISNTAISATYRQCRCNAGFTGTGEGIRGCQRVSSTNCLNNPCQNGGTCITYKNHEVNDFYCSCPQQFSGRYCENVINQCRSNPCLNGGRCREEHGYPLCECTGEYMGMDCSQHRSTCGGQLDSPSGTLTFPSVSPNNNSSFRYANNVTCIWVIENNQQSTKVLNVTFTQFKMEQSPSCAFDYLEIFDGPSREYRNLGKFCGDKILPKGGNIITSFNSIYIKFRSDASVSHEGFSLTWNTIEPQCGGLIMNRTTGIIESPGYPHHYPANRDCHWEIIADYGKRIQFIFTDLDIEPSQNCTFDYLIIRESLSRLPPPPSTRNRTMNSKNDDISIIARFCNWTSTAEQSVPPPITTSGSFARLHFHSDPGIHSRGFHLVFNQMPGVCGGILTGSSGVFQSPSTTYTSSLTGRTFLIYQNNIICDWLIRVMPNERISLRFLSFALESDSVVTRSNNQSGLCMFDYVEIYDGETFQSPLRARLCGRIIPPEIISTGRYLRVKFRSDMSVSLRGFIAKYQALCGGEYAEPQGMIESPNFPAPSLLSKNCTYRIIAPIDHIIEFKVEKIDIEYDHRCMFDYLMVQGQRYCGQSIPPPIYSMNNELKVFYVNDESKPSIGFRGTYRTIEIGCGGVLKQGEPMIAISAERVSTAVNQCFWEIRANQSHLIMLKFFHTETQSSSIDTSSNSGDGSSDEISRHLAELRVDCDDHYIMVNDSDGSLIRKFCIEHLPPPISSTGNSLFITYVLNVTENQDIDSSDMNLTDTSNISFASTTTTSTTMKPSMLSQWNRLKVKSFYATYHFVPAQTFCDRNIFKNTGTIRSPKYPRRYPGNRNCTWVIHVDNGLQIQLKFKEFRLEPPSEVNNKCYDYLEIRNGRRPDSPLIGQFCGFGPIPEIISHSNYLFLRFISDPSMQNKGFELSYEAIATGCGGTLTAESGSIESPGFPDHYPSNMNCEWNIRVARGSIIVAYLVALDMEAPNGAKNCGFDYLQIFDNKNGNDQLKSLGKYCNRIEGALPVLRTTGNEMFIRFVTDATINQGGFKLNYQTHCNRTMLGRYGVIESPNYPDPHPHNLNCVWHILAPLGNNISIAFTQLVLESNVDCKFDYINISEVVRPQQYSLSQSHMLNSNEPFNMSRIITLCGNYSGALPSIIQTGQNEAIIQFVSDETRSIESGFRLEWSAVGCGGEIRNHAYGVISSPNYPNPYPLNVECLWHIYAEPGYRVDLFIENIDLEFSHGCTFDSLEIFSGENDKDSPLLLKQCHRASNIHLSSYGNAMTIKITSDPYASKQGFNASFHTTERGCGGTYFADQGILLSPNYGGGNHYDPKTDCSYRLIAEENFDIELIINDYDIPVSINCSTNYLAIYDGFFDETDSVLLAKLCGQYQPNKELRFRSNSSILSVKLLSDGIHSGRGFNMTYRKVCGKTIIIDDDEQYRTLFSPNYPNPNYYNEDCEFILKSSKPENRLTLRFTHFDSSTAPANIEYGIDKCELIKAEIYEGIEKIPEKKLQTLCSNTIPQSIVSQGNSLLLSVRTAIFRALVSSIHSFCGGDFHSTNGYIATPGYPNSYPLNIECIWMLEAAPGNRFQLKFEGFDIESSDYCNNDYLEIRLDNSSGLILGSTDGRQRLCGQSDGKQKPYPVIDIDFPGSLWIKFRSDEIGVAKGFLLYFQIASITYLSSTEGLIGSPGWPNGYYFENISYVWYIAVPHNHYVHLKFEEFSIQGDQSINFCPLQLSVYNGFIDFAKISSSESTVTSDQLLASSLPSILPEPKQSYCGQTIPKDFIADANAITLMYESKFVLYLPIGQNKFLIRWSMINSTEYTNIKQNGFVSDNVNSTFNIFLDNHQSYNLLSDNFSSYGNDINWYFRTKTSMHMNITVNLMLINPISSCWSNKMTVYVRNSMNQWQSMKTICNSMKEPIEVLGSNEFRLHLQYFKTFEGMTSTAKYNLTIAPVCGGNFTDQPNGEIDSSDDVDEHVRGVKQCEWRIKVREGRTIRFHVEFYSIGFIIDTSSCQNRGESLEIHNGHSSDSPLLTRPLCGHASTWFTLPDTSTNYAYVVYRSKRATNSFRIRFEEVGIKCGGDFIIDRAGNDVIISSPDYPESPKHDVTCEWIIRGPLAYGLQITFDQEKVSSSCDADNSYIEIYNGGTALSGLIERICVPPSNRNTIVVNSHVTLIRYVLKKVIFQSKFKATVAVEGCNREYFVPFGNLLSDKFGSLPSLDDEYRFPNFDNLKKSSLHKTDLCTIRLITQADFYITINITSILLNGEDCSKGDIIEIKESYNSPTNLLKLCPPRNETKVPNTVITSQSNELFIVYKRINMMPNVDGGNTALSYNNDQKIGIKFYASAKYRRCYHFIDLRQNPTGLIFLHDTPLHSSTRRVSCQWLFYNDPGQQITLAFSWFDLGHYEMSDNNNNNVGNGINNNPNNGITERKKPKQLRCNKFMLIQRNYFVPPLLANKYGCTKLRPRFIRSLTHVMTIKLYAKELNPAEGFSLIYNSFTNDHNDNNSICSALWDSSYGQFKSIDFDYDKNLTGLISCAWEMKIGFNQSASLVIDVFDVPGDCSNSTLNIGQLNSVSKIFGTRHMICIPESRKPQKVGMKFIVPIFRDFDASLALNPTVFLNFNRSTAGVYKGIRGEYYVQKCGGSFDPSFEQEFKSPSYPNAYPSSTFCHWIFKRMNIDFEANSIPGYKLTFLEFDIGHNCDQDYFLLQLNPHYEWQGSERICATTNSLPVPIYITHGIILSFVSSQNLSLSPATTNSNNYDNSQRKFRFRIQPIAHGCGGLLASHNGFFQSPNYSNDSESETGFGALTNHQYPPSIECVWTVKALPDFHLEFEFVSRFDLEQTDNCVNDYLLFEERDGLSSNIDQWTRISILCGHQTPKPIISQSDLVRITFRTNDKIQGDGFRVQYRQKCGGQYEDEFGFIYSPNYFTQGSYGNDLTCVYRIRRNPDEHIQITFEEFDIEHHTNCMFDSVTIYLGDHQNSSTKSYGPYCGKLAPPSLVSNELLTIVFHSDLMVTKRGFKVRYNVTKCGGNITVSNNDGGEIISPTGLQRECTWNIITSDERMSVALEIIELDLGNDHCRYGCCSFLKIMENTDEIMHPPLAYLCSNITDQVTFKSTGNQLIVYMMQDVWQVAAVPKFRLRYWSTPGPSSNCGGHFDSVDQGVIVSPDLDGDSFYEKQLNCIWTITGSDENQIISLEFERFDVVTSANESDPNRCINGGDYLIVYDGVSIHSQQLAILCGRTMIPDKMKSTTNSLLLQFITNQDTLAGHGFRAHFQVEKRICGGTIISSETPSVMTSPGYPNQYERPLQCSWEIYGPYSYFRTPIILKFNELDLDCSRGDYVQIIQFRQSAYESYLFSPITLCSSPAPFKFMSGLNNRIQLRMKTFVDPVKTEYNDVEKNRTMPTKSLYRGFNLTHHFSLCNESLEGPDNGFIANKNFPLPTLVHMNMFCQINITVAEDRQISLYFDQLSLYICSHSNLTIYDNQPKKEKRQLFGTYCDQETIPNPLFTTTNQLTLIIQARHLMRVPGTPINPHHNRNKILYSLTYTSQPKTMSPGCGGNFTSIRGSFTSPEYPFPYMKDQPCVWTINTNGYHTITLTFDEFMLAEPCDKHYLKIYDGNEDLEEKLLATFCGMDKPAPIQGLSNSMLIKFYSSDYNYQPGFRLSYRTNTKEPTIKGRVVTKNTFRFYRDYRVFME